MKDARDDSKNAVRYSKNLHKGLQKNKKAKIYCLGKYTKIELKKIFNNKIVHPDSKYSSESLLELIAKENINKEMPVQQTRSFTGALARRSTTSARSIVTRKL